MKNGNLLEIKPEQLKTLIKSRYGTNSRPLYVHGHRGVGKSEIIEQCAKELGIEFKAINLAVLEAPDLQGLNTIQNNVTCYARPSLLPAEGKGILFLDEMPRAPLDIRQGLLQLLTTRAVNDHKIGDGWMFVAAGNLNVDDGVQYSQDELDPAFSDRFSHYFLKSSPQVVIKYLSDIYGADSLAMQWASSDPNVISLDGKGASPRSFEAFARALRNHPNLDPHTIACGEVGLNGAAAFQAFLTNTDPLSFDEILKMTERAEGVLSKVQKEKAGRADILDMILANFEKKLATPNVDRVMTENELRPLGWFVSQLHAPEWRQTFLSKLHTLIGRAEDQRANITAIYKMFPAAQKNINEHISLINKTKKKIEKAEAQTK